MRSSAASTVIQGNFPTLAESMGKSGPRKKPPPQHPPKTRSSSLSLKAAYSSMTSTSTPEKGADTRAASAAQSTAAPASATASAAAPAATSKSGAKSLEEQGQAMFPRKQKDKEDKDPGMSYTRMVVEAARRQGEKPASSEGADWEELKKKQWSNNITKTSVEISHTALSTVPLPTLLMGRLLNPQPFESPVQGWAELGPEKKQMNKKTHKRMFHGIVLR